MAEKECITIRVTRAEAGTRFDRLLHTHVPWRARPALKALIEAGEIRLNGRAAKPAGRVAAGDLVETPIRDPRALSRQSLARSLPVIVEDPDFVVIDKPAGLSTHATGRYLKENVVSALRWQYGDPSPMPVHRLDRETSGALLCARNRTAHRALALQFERREVEKRYVAIVTGGPVEEAGVLAGRIARKAGSRVQIRVSARAGYGAPAQLNFRVAARWPGFSLLELTPRSGRRHQIRAQLEAAGCPVLGDKIYGPDEGYFLANLEGRLTVAARRSLTLDRHALHAASLVFRHPRTGQRVCTESGLPSDMADFIGSLGRTGGGQEERRAARRLHSKGEGGTSPRS